MEYCETPFRGDGAVSKLSRGKKFVTATARITRNGATSRGVQRLALEKETYALRRRILQRAYYLAGDQAFEAEDYDTAAEYYLLAGDYSDAYRRATACLYAPAVEAMEQGEYARAAEMLEKITDEASFIELVTASVCTQQVHGPKRKQKTASTTAPFFHPKAFLRTKERSHTYSFIDSL